MSNISEILYVISILYSCAIMCILIYAYVSIGINILRKGVNIDVLVGTIIYTIFFAFLVLNFVVASTRFDIGSYGIFLTLLILFTINIFDPIKSEDLNTEIEKLTTAKRRIIFLILIDFSFILTALGYVTEML